MHAFEKAPPDVKEILAKPIRELGLKLEGSPLERFVHRLRTELDRKGLKRFRPRCYLTDEWGCPSGQPVIGIPFYLADPNLAKLEKEMNDLEDDREIMMYLRHEAGHAFNYAYEVYKRPEWRNLFGPFRRAYRDDYRPIPFSRRFVRHIAGWYAQKHPDEDFAETFAVWMNPQSDWRSRYADWPALKKLEYMESLMHGLADKPMLVQTHRRVDPLPSIKKTLHAHYDRKRRHYGLLHPDFYDRDLRRLFSDRPEHQTNMKAARFIARVRKDVRRMVAGWTGEYQYTIDQVVEAMIKRANELNLRLATPEDRTKLDFLVLLTVQTMNYLHSGRHRVAL